MASKQVIYNSCWYTFLVDIYISIVQVFLCALLVAACAVFSVLGRPTDIVDSSLKENPPTGVIRVRFPTHSGLEEVEIFNRLLPPSSGTKSEPSQNHEESRDLNSKRQGIEAIQFLENESDIYWLILFS